MLDAGKYEAGEGVVLNISANIFQSALKFLFDTLNTSVSNEKSPCFISALDVDTSFKTPE